MLLILYLRGHCDSQVKSWYLCKAIIHHSLQISTCDQLKNKMDSTIQFLMHDYVWKIHRNEKGRMLLILYLRGHCDSQVKSRYRCKAIVHHNLQILICDPLKTNWTELSNS